MLGDKTIVDTAQVNADASATNGASVAFGYAYDNGETQTIETLTPTKTLVSAGNKQYEFTGWEVTYYTDAVSGSDVSEGVNNVFGALQNESNMGTQVHDIGESIVLSTHVKLVAQWKEVDYYVGKPISIQVYLDGQPVALSEDTPIGTYLDVEKDTGTLSWDFAEYKDGKAFYDYTYKDNACADIIFKLNSNYLLEGISADLQRMAR